MIKKISAAVLITDGTRFLVGRESQTQKWDILRIKTIKDIENTSDINLIVSYYINKMTNIKLEFDKMDVIGIFPFYKDKDIILYKYHMDSLPDLSEIKCGYKIKNTFNDKPLFKIDAFALIENKNLHRYTSIKTYNLISTFL